MHFVLCDDDAMMRSMVESVVTRQGHDVIGIAETTMDGASLVATARPDVVVVDPSIGVNTDFDVLAAAESSGSRVIVFSFSAGGLLYDQYAERPLVVVKPDLAELERVIERLELASAPAGGVTHDRRLRPGRAASGPTPAGVGDAGAFYEALNNAVEGDTLLSIEFSASGSVDWEDVGNRVALAIRGTDRLLASPTSVRVYLAGGSTDGAASLVDRLRRDVAVPTEWTIKSVIVGPGEAPADAFDRLKRAG
jgi:hypothetical protein